MKSLTDGRSTRWQEHRDLRRRELLRAVRHVVDEHGDDLSMGQISEYSGTTKAALYRYFTDRAGLQAAMGEWAMEVIAKSLDDAGAARTASSSAPTAPPAQESLTPQEALTAMIGAFVTLAAGSPSVYRFCDTAVNRFAPTETGGFFNSIARLLAERVGLEGPEGTLWASGAIGFVRAATENWLADPGPPEEFAATISRWLWASLQQSTVTEHTQERNT
ncbi:TetR family transcriptional regulator [Brevibacterium sanguinis]|uniref:TetR family transcriptional regulator n=2 Tax=Brevibacterium TaxID=1696 RepID=A0A366IIJ2_9MICO|nr:MULTISPECIES: TetR/AcrR family transcriptional regulator [Brevibacterium]RBP64674.1 TetR family transcriptional regulator [Brevibacterium sanguinis]RBP71683.1 TetR family transcriptional regulator [Brevibacterium celere]